MIFSKLIYAFIAIFILFLSSNIYSRSLTIGILSANSRFKNILLKEIGKEYRLCNNFNKCDLLICDGIKNIKACLKYNKKIVATGIYTYQIKKIENKKIIAYFPVDLSPKILYSALVKKLKINLKPCIITHYKILNLPDNFKVFYVKNINVVPFIINNALKSCDVIIGIPDDVVFNYFSTRFIFKKVILNGKLITGFTKEMNILGAVLSYEINYKKYAEKISKFLNSVENKKIIRLSIDDVKLFYNNSILKCIK